MHVVLYRAKRSWFSNFRSEREKEEVVAVYRDKGFQELKASILQAMNVSFFWFCNLLTLCNISLGR